MAPSVALPQVVGQIVLIAIPLLVAIVCHEAAHGAVAYAFGDPTAARAGRLTLNPIPHVDPVGTLLLPGLLLLAPLLFGTRPFVFGWARPVPVDVRRLRNPRRDGLLVAAAGPAANLGLAAASVVVLGLLPATESTPLIEGARQLALTSLVVNCVLAVFNLLPVPPLDGGRVLAAVLPVPAARALSRVEGPGFVLILLLVLNTDVLGTLVRPVIGFFLAWLA